ncbi:MAG: glycosyltransferase family 4 protein [Vicinamibacterales bacterium]
MRLLYLTPTSAMGGAERVLLDLITMVRSARPDWRLGLVIGNEGPLAADVRQLGVATTVLPFPRDFARLGDAGLQSPGTWARFVRHAVGGSVATARYARRLQSHVSAFDPDIVHTNGIKMHVLGALVKPTRADLVWHFHDYPSSRPVTSRLVRSLRSRCSAVVAVSDSVAGDIREQVGAPVDVRTIWNSVDLSRFTPDGPQVDLASLAGMPPQEPGIPTIGLVAAYARWKGHLLYLEALRRLSSTHRFRAYIVGGPLYETNGSQYSTEELRRAIDRLGLADTVGLTGFIKDSPAALRSLDIVVHASTSPEPFGLVVAEAMASGRTVLVSDAGGVAELVTPEVNALTYRGGDVDQMTAQLARLLDDPGFRTVLGERARRSAADQFNPARTCRQMVELYEGFGRAVRAA